MNTRNLWKQASSLCIVLAAGMLSVATAQVAPQPSVTATDSKQDESVKLEKFVVTGSLIKRLESESALPVVTITPLEMEQRGVVSVEEMLMDLNINGNGLDNLASNADVVAGQVRGNNGASSANLRMQGATATLILLNGRRVAAHGLNGGIVDLNQIPFAAVQRVEVLKDGASATYGTDAVGGVINFILKTNYQGFSATAASDVTEEGGGNIFRYSAVAGFGDLQKQHFNIMQSVSYADHKRLAGTQRKWLTSNDPARGVSTDTRGTPIATIVPFTTFFSAISRDDLTTTGRGTGPLDPAGGTVAMSGGINILNVPGGPGFGGTDMFPYDYRLWANPSAKYAAAWDTGAAAVLAQPIQTKNSVTRAIYRIGEHRITGELVLGRSESIKSFSAQQIQTSTTATVTALDGVTTIPRPEFNLSYPSTGADYNRVFNILANYFPSIAANRGAPIGFRWRASVLGNREYYTRSDTWRGLIGIEGPIPFLRNWDYRAGVSRASSRPYSILRQGYVFSHAFENLIRTGVVSPFSYTQTPEAMAAIEKTKADGVKLYSGRYKTEQADLSGTGPLFRVPAGMMQGAVGVDYRKEIYGFDGDERKNLGTAEAYIASAAFDNVNATKPLSRDIKAVFAELQIPVVKNLDVTAAGRIDQYTGFGSTKNPKFQVRWAPSEKLMFRSAYSTGFRVPTFTQQFNPTTSSTYVGNDFSDPGKGDYRIVDATHPAVHPAILTGGKPDLQPETAKMYSAGFVFQLSRAISGNVDWWSVQRDGTIASTGLTQLAQNYSTFADRFFRNAAGEIVAVDTRWLNAGRTSTKGIEYGLKGNFDGPFEGKISAGFDLAYLLEKKSKLLPTAPWGAQEINEFTRFSDLGLRWKHTAHLGYRKGNWAFQFNNTFRNSYVDTALPGVFNGTVKPPLLDPTVDSYNIYGLSVTYRGLKNATIIAGVKNLFNRHPPFSAVYDTNTGAGANWEPRVADPRDRSYTLRIDYKFW